MFKKKWIMLLISITAGMLITQSTQVFGDENGKINSFYNQDWPGVTEGPEISFNGPYVSLTLGGGYNKR